MNLKTLRSVFPPTTTLIPFLPYVTNKSLWSLDEGRTLLSRLLFFLRLHIGNLKSDLGHSRPSWPFAAPQMYLKPIGKEGPRAVGAWLKHLLVPIVEGLLIVGAQLVLAYFTAEDVIKVLWWFGNRFTIFFRSLRLFYFPLFLACFNMNLKTSRTIFSTTNIAYQGLWSLYLRRLW